MNNNMIKFLPTLFLLILLDSVVSAQAAGDYRSKQNGTWGAAVNWETWSGTAWVDATVAPNSTNGVITVNHTMTISATITLDQVVVSSTGTINVSGTPTITIADGTGTDFENNGTVNFASRPFIVNGQLVNNATITATTGSLTIGATGSLSNASTGTMNIGPLTNNNVIVNNGSMTNGGAVNLSTATSNITNNGTWNVNLTFTLNNATSSFTNSSSGILTVSATGSFTLSNGSFTNNGGGAVTNNGIFTLSNGTFTNAGNFYNNNTFVNNLMTLTLTTPITNAVNSIFRYSRNGDQTVYEIPYYHLEIGGSAATNNKTLNLSANYSLSGNLTLLPSASNAVFVINGAFNFNIFGTTTINQNSKLQPSSSTIIQSSNTINLNNLGEIRVTNNTSSTPLSTQYQNFSSWNVQDSGIVNYYANGSQTIEETLPGGISYGSLYITSTGVALNKTLTLTSNRTVRGNLIVSSTTAGGSLGFLGNGTISIGGRLDITNNGLTHVEPTVTFSATGVNSYMNVGANTQLKITQNAFTIQYQNFKYISCAASSVQIFISNNAQTIEALPTDGPLRPYGHLRLVGSKGSNNITFQSTIIGIQSSFIDSTTFSSGLLDFANSTIRFLNTAYSYSRSINRTSYKFYNLEFYGSADHRFATNIEVQNNLIISSNTFISFDHYYPVAIKVSGTSTFEQNTVASSSPKISFIFGRSNVGEFNDINIIGNQQLIVAGGHTSNPTRRGLLYINGNVTNNNSSLTTLLSGNNVTTYFISTSLKTIGGSNSVVLSDSAKVVGPWQLSNHLVLNAASTVDFVLNNASLNLNTFQLVSTGTGAPHNLEYLPSNVTMPPATDPFCSHAQVINWNCVKAETIYVSTAGNNSNNGLTPGTAVRDMRVAVRKVAHGGVIMVANGTYTEIFDVKKKVKIHGESNINTILQAPTGLSAPDPSCLAVSQQNDSAVVYFNTYSDSSHLYNVKINHNVSRVRRGVVIGVGVKGLVVENCNFEGTYDTGMFGIPSIPSYEDCPYSGISANDEVYSINALNGTSFDIRNNSFTGFATRTIGIYDAGDYQSTSYIRNNTINNTTPFSYGKQGIWLYDSWNINVENNNITGTQLDYALDVSNIKSILPRTGNILATNNTINASTTNVSQCVVKEGTTEGTVTFQNNIISTKSGSIGIKIETTSNVNVLNNTFTPVSNNFKHIVLDNQSSFAAAVGANIYGNTFNSFSSFGGTAIQALMFNPSLDYTQLNLNGSALGYPNNIYTSNTQYFLDATQNLGANADTIDMTDGNTFPISGLFDLYTVEERIVHRMDDMRGASGASYPRPIVFVKPRNYYVCNENASGVVIPIDNRSIQDGIDFAANHDTINVQRTTFSYPTATEFESIVNFNKPLSFRSNNNGGQPIIDRFIQVNLPATTDSVTQYNNFTFSDGATQNLTFNVNQGDWVLNGGVITFAATNATLSEALNNTIRGYTGWIQTTRNIGAPTSLNIAGFGAELTSAVNMGTTTIRRGHWEQTVPTGRSVLRVFNISPTTNSGLNATFRFRYDPSELVSGQNPMDLRHHRNANNFSPWHNNYNIVPYTLQGGTAFTNYVDLSGINAFSTWTLADPTILPVELLAFNATLVNRNSVRLDWFVANEINFSHYEIEKSYDLTSFTKIGDNVSATGQANYLGWDYEPKVGVNYYRLKMVDLDGSYKYSEIRTVIIDPTQEVSLLVYPNPFNDNLQISLTGVDHLPCDIYITDAIGKLVYTQRIDDWKGNTSMDLSKLSSGVYYLKLQAGDKSIGTKLIKN